MDRSNDLEGLSPVQQMQYGPLMKRNAGTPSAYRSGIKTIRAMTGATRTVPPNASPTSSGLRSLDYEQLLERLLQLQAADPPANAPPLHLYRTEAEEHGEVYIASPEYRQWFRRTYPRASKLGDCPRPAPRSSAEGQGSSKLDRFKPT